MKKYTRHMIEFISETQGLLYSAVASQGVDMQEFSRLYMHSEFCKRSMDQTSRFQYDDDDVILFYLQKEIGDTLPKYGGSKSFDDNVAYWIGWTYRYLFYCCDCSSQEIADKIDFAKMVSYYPGMHTIDEDNAAEIMLHDADIEYVPIDD